MSIESVTEVICDAYIILVIVELQDVQPFLHNSGREQHVDVAARWLCVYGSLYN